MTPFAIKVRKSMSSFYKSADLEGRVRTKSIAVLIEIHFKDREGFVPSCLGQLLHPRSESILVWEVCDYMTPLKGDIQEDVALCSAHQPFGGLKR